MLDASQTNQNGDGGNVAKCQYAPCLGGHKAVNGSYNAGSSF
jgi:hypothetical protein